MGKTYKDKPEKYHLLSPKGKLREREGRRFESSKGRKHTNLKALIRKDQTENEY